MSISLPLQEELRLVKQCQVDIDAFGKIYDHYYPHIFRYVNCRVFNYEEAYDITATTFYNALKKIKSFEMEAKMMEMKSHPKAKNIKKMVTFYKDLYKKLDKNAARAGVPDMLRTVL